MIESGDSQSEVLTSKDIECGWVQGLTSDLGHTG